MLEFKYKNMLTAEQKQQILNSSNFQYLIKKPEPVADTTGLSFVERARQAREQKALPTSPTLPTQKKEEPSFFDKLKETGRDIKETVGDVGKTIGETKEKIGDIVEGEEAGEQGKWRSFAQAFGTIAGGLSKAGGDVVKGAVKTVLSQEEEEKVKKAVAETIETIAPIAKKIDESIGSPAGTFIENYKNLDDKSKRDVDSLLGISSLSFDVATAGVTKKVGGIGVKEGKNVLKASKEAVEAGVDVAKKTGKEVAETVTEGATKFGEKAKKVVSEGAEKLKTDVKTKESIKTEIDKLIESKRTYVKAENSKQFKNTKLRETLSDPDVYGGLKIKDGKLNPDDAIKTLNERVERAMKGKTEGVKIADETLPAISKNKLIDEIAENLPDDIAPEELRKLKISIEKQLKSIPDSITTSELDTLRKQFRNSGVNAKGIQKEKGHFEVLENATRSLLFKKLDELPGAKGEFAKVSTLVKNNLNVIDFLNNTARGHIVTSGKMTKMLSQMGGIVLGGGVGGPFGGLAGAVGAGKIADIMANKALGNSLKKEVLKKLSNGTPEAIKEVEKLLEKIPKNKLLPEAEQKLLEAGIIKLPSKTQSLNKINVPTKANTKPSIKPIDNNLVNNADSITDSNKKVKLPKQTKISKSNIKKVTDGIDIGEVANHQVATAIKNTPEIAIPLFKKYGQFKKINSEIIKTIENSLNTGKKLVGEPLRVMKEFLTTKTNNVKKWLKELKSNQAGFQKLPSFSNAEEARDVVKESLDKFLKDKNILVSERETAQEFLGQIEKGTDDLDDIMSFLQEKSDFKVETVKKQLWDKQ